MFNIRFQINEEGEMTNWQEKTDFEINVAVTAIVKKCSHWELNCRNFYYCGAGGIGYFVQGVIDYCNNPAFAWSIISEHKISLMNNDDNWEASIDFDGDLEKHGTDETLSKFYEDKNPLRAAMIVFLMINEDKK